MLRGPMRFAIGVGLRSCEDSRLTPNAMRPRGRGEAGVEAADILPPHQWALLAFGDDCQLRPFGNRKAARGVLITQYDRS